MSRAILLNLHIFFLLIFLWSLLCTFLLSKATETDIDCLKSIEVSLEDPLGKLTSWDFSNNTEGSICGFIGIDCWHPNESRVVNIRLSGMGLRGQFPRDVGKCTSLTGLDLSNNELQGPIPFDIAERLPYVTSLDLSFNNLSGEIPSSIANCTFLNVLKLNNNRLTGSIPMEIGLLSRLKTFSVANNLLSGPQPTFRDASFANNSAFQPSFIDTSFTRESFANNSGLCGRPLEPCGRHRWKFDSLKKGFTIGYAISFVLIIVAFIPYDIPPWLKFKTKNKKLKMRRNISQVTELATVDNLPEGGTEILKLEKVVPRLPYRDISNATNNFSEKNIIGLGKMGILFKATLSSGGFLAVKKLHYAQFLDKRFTAELKMLGIMRHINLLPLLGFCINSKERLLVYKYMPNGSLYDWLKLVEDQAKVLEWPLRVKIATGLARGLAWLHQGCNIHIIHLNISSKCVLLDYDFEPKLSNFGEAILLIPKNSSCANTEVWEMEFIKEDVYSFGIVLLELITGKDSSKMTSNYCSNSYDRSSNDWVSHILDSNSSNFHDLPDKSLIGQGFDDEIHQVLQIALSCVQSISEQRPTMRQVYEDMKAVRNRYGLTDHSYLSTKPETSTAGYKGKSVEIEIAETN